MEASTFAKRPTKDLSSFYKYFKEKSLVLDVGCGEGRNSIFLAEQGHIVDAFDISKAGISKAIFIANTKRVNVNLYIRDLAEFRFEKEYDIILSHGVLHLPEKAVRDAFIAEIQKHTKVGGYNIIGIFTNRLPATPDNAPFTKGLFYVGELPEKYSYWKILSHNEGILRDTHPGDIHHEHSYENIIAQKMS
jgi:tellurite methyltransferase